LAWFTPFKLSYVVQGLPLPSKPIAEIYAILRFIGTITATILTTGAIVGAIASVNTLVVLIAINVIARLRMLIDAAALSAIV